MFDIVLSLDGGADIVKLLEIDQSLQSIPLGEALYEFGSMLIDAADKIIRDADVENSIRTIGKNIDPSTSHVEILKDVDGRDKPGHDEKSSFS